MATGSAGGEHKIAGWVDAERAGHWLCRHLPNRGQMSSGGIDGELPSPLSGRIDSLLNFHSTGSTHPPLGGFAPPVATALRPFGTPVSASRRDVGNGTLPKQWHTRRIRRVKPLAATTDFAAMRIHLQKCKPNGSRQRAKRGPDCREWLLRLPE